MSFSGIFTVYCTISSNKFVSTLIIKDAHVLVIAQSSVVASWIKFHRKETFGLLVLIAGFIDEPVN